MKKTITLICLLMTNAAALFGQQLMVYINDRPVKNNSIVSIVPNYIDVKIISKPIEYTIAEGKFSIRDRSGKKVLFSSRIDTSFIDSLPYEYTPGSKVLIEVKSIRNVKTGTVSPFDRFVVFKMDSVLFPEENPYHELLINGGVSYKREGIKIDSIRTVELKSKSNNLSDTIEVVQARSLRAVRSTTYSSRKGLERFYKEGYPGDRFIVSIWDKDRRRKWIWVVPIK